MSLDKFIQAHIDNLRARVANPYFKDLMGTLEVSYRAAIRAMPADGVPNTFGRFLLICDKAMRAGAMLIAARQPEDSVAITRRAIEAAKTALAIKLNDANVANWLSSEERMARWAARQSNEKPKFFKIALENVKGDPLIDELDAFLGILSDAYVHFTPEFYSSLAWEVRANAEGAGGQIILNYFHTNEREIERHYTLLAAVHGLILRAFDRCADGRMLQDSACRESVNKFQRLGRELNAEYQRKYQEPAIPET
jgi:hypothetical protein